MVIISSTLRGECNSVHSASKRFKDSSHDSILVKMCALSAPSVLCLFALVTITNAGGVCRGRATCIGLRECIPVMTLLDTLHKPLKPSVVQFLRAQQCGFADGYPLICCGVLPRNLKIFQKHAKSSKRLEKEHAVKLNRAPVIIPTTTPTPPSAKHLSIYRSMDKTHRRRVMQQRPYFDITVSTAPPDASTVPYLNHIKRAAFLKLGGRNKHAPVFNINEQFGDAIGEYMEHYDLLRTRRADATDGSEQLDIEVR